VVAADAEPIPGYRLLARVGEGGSGEVWRALGPGDFPVALKFIALKDTNEIVNSRSPDAGELRALRLMRKLRHAHLLAVFGVWQLGDILVVGMELAERTLLDRWEEVVGQGLSGIPFAELIEYLWQAAQGIDYLNEPRHAVLEQTGVGILHCDIKPQNLLLIGDSIKVGDFGLATALEGDSVGIDGLTPAYAAPEFFQGQLSRQADQYALAVTYCQLRGGRLPFIGNRWELILKHCLDAPDLSMLPETERPAVARALGKSPQERWPSCRAFVSALRDSNIPRPSCGEAPSPDLVQALIAFHEQLGLTTREVTCPAEQTSPLGEVWVDQMFADG
jgi:serine/threonine protein kinase